MQDYTILIVDDNVELLEVLGITLSQDYRVFKAQSAQEALDLLSKEQVDLIITDQRMPNMTGIEFLEKTLEYDPRMIKILITAYTDEEDLIKAVTEIT